MSMTASNLIRRLEKQEKGICSVDLRGTSCLNRQETKNPRPHIVQLTRSIHNYECYCDLKLFSLHNNFLNRCEMSSLFNVLADLPSLETLVIFHHDLGDDAVGLLLDALTGAKVNSVYRQTPSLSGSHSTGLKELYLPHCKIGCKGASRIADALICSSPQSFGSSVSASNRLRHLQVLGLGSNLIKDVGARCLYKAFEQCPFLHRLVLHGNIHVTSPGANDILRCTLSSIGWQRKPWFNSHGAERHATPMHIISPLVSSHILSRWDSDRVLVRPMDLARQRMLVEMLKHGSTFIDDQVRRMDEILSWMGRTGICSRPPISHSQIGKNSSHPHSNIKLHSRGCQRMCGVHKYSSK